MENNINSTEISQIQSNFSFEYYLRQLDKYVEKNINDFSKEYQSSIRIGIYGISLGIFGVGSLYRRSILKGFGNGLTFYLISSLILCRDNLNPYSKYKI